MAILKMAATAIKSLFSRPATLMYPARPAKRTPATRGHIVIDPANCITCRSCQRKCPTGAICVEVKEKTWQIDRMRCVICNSCGDVCPTKCLSMDPAYPPALTARGGVYKVTVAGPKKKEPATPAADNPKQDKI
jgi:formate hydrogenlyase subunit 6/NADH:ubiquinone oxidoreductase subunit I